MQRSAGHQVSKSVKPTHQHEQQADEDCEEDEEWQHPEGNLCGVLAAQHKGADDEEEHERDQRCQQWGEEPGDDNRHDAAHIGEVRAGLVPRDSLTTTKGQGKTCRMAAAAGAGQGGDSSEVACCV
jgi:hypothetical protein